MVRWVNFGLYSALELIKYDLQKSLKQFISLREGFVHWLSQNLSWKESNFELFLSVVFCRKHHI
jgi:hypothetical protein